MFSGFVRVGFALSLLLGLSSCSSNTTPSDSATSGSSVPATTASQTAGTATGTPSGASASQTAEASAAAEASATAEASAIDLAGTSWTLVKGALNSIDLAKFKITLEFTDSQASGFAGVNQYHGSYKAKASGALEFGPLASTMMAGPPDAMAAEQAYLQALGEVNHYSATDAELTLVTPGGMTLGYTKAG